MSNYDNEPENFTHCKLVDPAALRPHPDNPNHHPAGQIAGLCAVIRANGWRNPVVVSNRSGYVIKGHGRLQAALKLRCRVPVSYQDYADDAAEARDMVADNTIAELSMLNPEKIAELRKRFHDAAEGWGDAASDGKLAQKQFGKLKDSAPKAVKFPILIIQSQDEFDLFEAVKPSGASDAKAFRQILIEAAKHRNLPLPPSLSQ